MAGSKQFLVVAAFYFDDVPLRIFDSKELAEAFADLLFRNGGNVRSLLPADILAGLPMAASDVAGSVWLWTFDAGLPVHREEIANFEDEE